MPIYGKVDRNMKKKSQTFRKFLALVLSVAMIITYMPTSVIALAYVDNVPKVTQEETSQESNQTTEARTTEEPAQEVEKPKEEPASDAETPAETGVTEPEEGQNKFKDPMSWPQRRGLFTWPPQHPRVNLLLGPGQRNCDPVHPQKKQLKQANRRER